MSDKTEREYRQNMLTILDRFYRGRGQSLLTKDESEALDYAISSIKTDLKYDLLYEETREKIPVLQDAKNGYKEYLSDDALDIAIKAFSRQAAINRIFQKWGENFRIEPTTKNDLAVDCISRQGAIDAIRRIHPIDTDYDCTLLDKVDVMYVLDELPSVTPQEPRWIPVNEELPKKTGWYLITFKVYGGGYAVCEMCYRKPENYWTDKDISKKVFDNDEVVAWMPLPKAYREVEK